MNVSHRDQNGSSMNSKIMTPQDMAKRIKKLDVHSPITSRFEKQLIERDMSDVDRRWYRTQKEHWLGWLGQYDSPGAYNRKQWKGRSAKFVYNHIVNPAMLLWLCEASGIPRTELIRASKSALTKGKRTYASQSGAIRKVIPWEAVHSCWVQNQ